MSGKRIVMIFLGFVVVFGAALVWFQNFAFYDRVEGLDAITVQGRQVSVAGYEGIDASSSGLKRRGCFRVDPADFDDVPEAADPVPLTPPFWFDCFDPETLARDIAAGRATAYIAATEEMDGIDRLVAVYPDGRAYEWRQLNERFSE